MAWHQAGIRPDNIGRPRQYSSNAERQKAYRQRKRYENS